MADEPQPITISWHRLLIHLIFIALAVYLAYAVVWKMFAETPLIEKGGGRRTPLGILVIVLAGAASWLFNLIYPVVAPTTDVRDRMKR
jgi:polyferredoxin